MVASDAAERQVQLATLQPASEPHRPVWLPGIEVLRGAAAVLVVVHHSWALSTMPTFPGYWIIQGFGTLGVTLFFLLSGYLLADGFWTPRRRGRLSRYWIRRFFRIAPAYYVTMGILFLFLAEHRLLFSSQGIRQVIANATFTHYLFPNTSSSLNVDGAAWTLTIEFTLYLALPLMAILFMRRPLLAFLSFIAIGVGWHLWIALAGSALRSLFFASGHQDPQIESLFIGRQFLGTVPVFALGIALKWLVINGKMTRMLTWIRTSRFAPWCATAAIFPIAFLAFVVRASSYHHWIWFSTFDVVLASLLAPLLLLAASDRWIGVTVAGRVGGWLGQRSYSLYLWHFPIILSVYGRGPLVAPPQLSHWPLRLMLIAGLSILAAHISYMAIEKPGMALGKRLAARVRTSTAGDGAERPKP